ncbi:MAG: ion transporter, partial [Bacteroidota bacterium]
MQNWRKKWYRIIFESDTPAGKLFDVILLIIIIISIFVAIVGSVPPVKEEIGEYLQLVEWIITVIFTLEYFIRIWVVRKPITYLFSFYGIIDFLSILPSYLGLFVRGTESLIVIRALRLLRVFRILKLGRYSREAE